MTRMDKTPRDVKYVTSLSVAAKPHFVA